MLDVISGMFSGSALGRAGEDQRCRADPARGGSRSHEAVPGDRRRGLDRDPHPQRQADHPPGRGAPTTVAARSSCCVRERTVRSRSSTGTALVDVRARSTDLPARSLTARERPPAPRARVVRLAADRLRPRPAGPRAGCRQRARSGPATSWAPRCATSCTTSTARCCRRTTCCRRASWRRAPTSCARTAASSCCGVIVTGDALTDGYLLSQAITPRPMTRAHREWDAAASVLATALSRPSSCAGRATAAGRSPGSRVVCAPRATGIRVPSTWATTSCAIFAGVRPASSRICSRVA